MIGMRKEFAGIVMTNSPASGQERVAQRTRLFYLVMALVLVR